MRRLWFASQCASINSINSSKANQKHANYFKNEQISQMNFQKEPITKIFFHTKPLEDYETINHAYLIAQTKYNNFIELNAGLSPTRAPQIELYFRNLDKNQIFPLNLQYEFIPYGDIPFEVLCKHSQNHWAYKTYDLEQRNCYHFCFDILETFCERNDFVLENIKKLYFQQQNEAKNQAQLFAFWKFIPTPVQKWIQSFKIY